MVFICSLDCMIGEGKDRIFYLTEFFFSKSGFNFGGNKMYFLVREGQDLVERFSLSDYLKGKNKRKKRNFKFRREWYFFFCFMSLKVKVYIQNLIFRQFLF